MDLSGNPVGCRRYAGLPRVPGGVLEDLLKAHLGPASADLAAAVCERLGVSVHPRSVERALQRRRTTGARTRRVASGPAGPPQKPLTSRLQPPGIAGNDRVSSYPARTSTADDEYNEHEEASLRYVTMLTPVPLGARENLIKTSLSTKRYSAIREKLSTASDWLSVKIPSVCLDSMNSLMTRRRPGGNCSSDRMPATQQMN